MKDLIRIIRYSWVLKPFYIATAIFVVVISLLNQADPFILKYLIDAIDKHVHGAPVASQYIIILLIAILISKLAITILSNISGYIGDIMAQKLNTLLSQRYYDHVLSLPLEYYDNEIAGRITSRLERSIVTITNLIQALANNFIGFFLTSAITLVILAYYSWPVAILLGGLFPFYIWLTTLSSRAWQKHQEGINRDIDYANGRFIESIGAIRVVKSFVQERVESRLFADRRRSVEAETKVQSGEWHKYDIIRRLGLNIVFFLIYSFIIWQTFSGHFSLGTAVLMLQLATQAQFPLFASSFIVEQTQRAAAGSKDFFEVMSTKASIKDAPGSKPLKVTDGKVEYRNVQFAYGGGAPVLNGINFNIDPDSKLALVGESGQGKTTIANLLLRLYEPSDGQILIDGQDIREVTQSSLRQNIGVVFQEPALFSGTVAENIGYSRPKASRKELEEAAVAANAHDFITKLPKSYDTEIGERGVKLSGGQKQRLAIARAILKNAPILILDEATSSLDSKAEHEVQGALSVLMQNRTTLIIAHRLSTISSVDIIVGLQDGQVSQMGSPAQLALQKGIYAELLQLQTPTKANKAKLRKYDLARV